MQNSKLMMLKGIGLGVVVTLSLTLGFGSTDSNTMPSKPDIPVHQASLKTYDYLDESKIVEMVDEEAPKYSVQDFQESIELSAKKATPAVVTVAASKLVKQQTFNPFDFFRERGNSQPQEREFESRQSGSGVIVSSDGYIVTNNHVIQGVEEVTVTTQDKRVFDAKIVGTDPLTDIALLKIESEDKLPSITFANSHKLIIGQQVLAIGNPLSIGTTVTSGIISALNRNINILRDSYGVEKFIQTDAAINPGNSGGALIDLNGNLIGINTAIASATGYYSGYGFAVPTSIVSHVVNELKETGEVKRGYIGVQLQEVSYKIAKAKGFKAPKGVYVFKVMDGMPGEEAGIEQDDLILEVDDVPVDEPNMLQAEISSKKYNSKVKLKIFRDGKTLTKTLQLRERTDADNITLASSDGSVDNMMGFSVTALSEFKAKQLEVDYGVEILEVKRFSEAFKENLKKGDVILKIGSKKLNKPSDLADYLKKIEPGDTIKLYVQPGNGSFKRYVYLNIPE